MTYDHLTFEQIDAGFMEDDSSPIVRAVMARVYHIFAANLRYFAEHGSMPPKWSADDHPPIDCYAFFIAYEAAEDRITNLNDDDLKRIRKMHREELRKQTD